MKFLRNILCFFGYHKMLFGFVHSEYGWYDKCKYCDHRTDPYEIED
jgi:hypothetical protein